MTFYTTSKETLFSRPGETSQDSIALASLVTATTAASLATAISSLKGVTTATA